MSGDIDHGGMRRASAYGTPLSRSARRWVVSGIPPQPASAGWVRSISRQAVASWDADSFEWVLSQLVTELAANVILHAETDFDVTLVFSPGECLRCEVSDADPNPPRTGGPPRQSISGRGLGLLDALASRWGVELRSDGKTVWFELDDPPVDREAR